MEKTKSNTISIILITLIIGLVVGYYIPQQRIQSQRKEINTLNEQIISQNKKLADFQNNVTSTTQLISILEERILELESQTITLKKHVPPIENLAPDFTLTDINGDIFTLSDHRGKFVIIDFMATWCDTCEYQMPNYFVLEEFSDEIVHISINIDQSVDADMKLRNITTRYNASWIFAKDTANVTELYEVQWIPSSYIIDKNGYLWSEHFGFYDALSLREDVEQVLSYWTNYSKPADVLPISAVEAYELIESEPELVVLDVRTVGEFDEEHVEGAVNIPLLELEERLDELVKDEIVLVYCLSGIRSMEASQILVENGFKYVYNLEGGITEWKAEGLPIVIRPN